MDTCRITLSHICYTATAATAVHTTCSVQGIRDAQDAIRTPSGRHQDAMATVEGTARFVERVVASGRLHPSNARRLGPFACTALGFGAYRLVPEGSATGAATAATASGALTRALDSVNVIDTSSHYAFGHSERVIGATLHGRPRDELIVCTKVGHVPRGEMPKGAVPIGAHRGAGTTSDDWHCISPTFVDSEVKACAERLGTKPDFVFLHNPEYLLSARMQEKVPIADAWDEMYQSLFEAFKILDRLCASASLKGCADTCRTSTHLFIVFAVFAVFDTFLIE